jgi:hypothetical protein
LQLQRSLHQRAWAHSWTLGDHTGTLRKIGIHVDEDDDSVVVATVDGVEVIRAVPPWISDRATLISDEAVTKRRDDFRAALLEAIGRHAKTNPEPPYIKSPA